MSDTIAKLVKNPIVLSLGAVLVGIGLYLFQPWQLFVDQTVDEAFPVSLSAEVQAEDQAMAVPDDEMSEDHEMTEDMPAAMPTDPVSLATGTFMDRSHPTSGEVGIFSLADGGRVLRIEDLETDNGPDLFVYLSTASADAPSGDFDDQFVSLGRLKGNIGSQNYEVPADLDLSLYSSIVIWCDRFDVAFGAAELN